MVKHHTRNNCCSEQLYHIKLLYKLRQTAELLNEVMIDLADYSQWLCDCMIGESIIVVVIIINTRTP